jgi:hypothetical protein
LPILNEKGPKRGRTFKKFVSLLLSSLILGRSKKYYYFPIHTDKNSVSVFLNLSKSENYWGTDFFSLAAEFSSGLAERKFLSVGFALAAVEDSSEFF